MADYNIYIHTVGSGSKQSSKTKAWSQNDEPENQTKGWNEKVSNFKDAVNFAQNPDSLVSTAIGTAAKALPAVATAFAVVKVGEIALELIDTFLTPETGDYRFNVAWGNFKNAVNNATHPFSATINFLRQRQEQRIQDEKNRLNIQLLGDINYFRGV